MARKRNYQWVAATRFDGSITQDKVGGVTQSVTPEVIEARLIEDGFVLDTDLPAPSSAAPQDLGTTNSGSSENYSRADHRHKMPSLADIGAVALGETSSTAYRGDRGKTAYDHSQTTGANPHNTTAAQVGALPLIQITGAVAFDSVNSGIPCAAEISASSATNSPANILAAGGKGFLIQGRGAAGYLTQLLTVPEFTAYRMMPASGVWAAWRIFWDREALPISTLGRDLLNDTTTSEMRATIGAAEAPAFITKSTSYDFTGITASLIKHTNGDVVATLSGGTPGRSYTLMSVAALLIAIPVGVTLYGSTGIWDHSTGFSLGGMRPITIQCMSSTEWLIPNYGE